MYRSTPPPEAGPVCALGMVDLSSTSGLPLWLDPQHEDLVPAGDGQAVRAEALPQRLVRSMLLDGGAHAARAACRMLRGVVLPADEGVFAGHRVRHNLLLLGSGGAGAESAKTRGYTQAAAGPRAWPEVFGVVFGSALFLLQRLVEGLLYSAFAQHPHRCSRLQERTPPVMGARGW